MKGPLILYHAPCRDGFCAAWVAHLYEERRVGAKGTAREAEYVGVQHGLPAPDCAGRDVVMLDFCYPRLDMERIAGEASSLVVLDHHASARDALEGFADAMAAAGRFVTVVFDMEHSGAGLAWRYFFPQIYINQPWLVSYVEDRDLWRHALQDSRAVNAYIGTLPFDFDAWDEVDREYSAVDIILVGQAVLDKTANYVAETKKLARRVSFDGHQVLAVNAPPTDVSELVEELAAGETFAIGWHQRADGKFVYSLRSRDGFDVAALAGKWGGGGHKAAAGFQSDTLLF